MWRGSNLDGRASVRERMQDRAMLVLKSLALVAATTIGLLILDRVFALRHVTLVYLVPVVIAATKLGIAPAVIANTWLMLPIALARAASLDMS